MLILHPLKCPSCGAPAALPPGARYYKCRHCGSLFFVEYREAAPETAILRQISKYPTVCPEQSLFRYKVASSDKWSRCYRSKIALTNGLALLQRDCSESNRPHSGETICHSERDNLHRCET